MEETKLQNLIKKLRNSKDKYKDGLELAELAEEFLGQAIEAENMYHDKIKMYVEDGEGISAATARAKSEPEYKIYKAAKLSYELSLEILRFVK